MMGREEYGEGKGTAHDPKHTVSSVKHGSGSVMGVGMYGCQWNWFPCIY